MKTEAEIRKRIADMKYALSLSCSCAAEGHGEECHIGRMVMVGTISILLWVLGENPKEDEFSKAVAAQRSRSGGH